MSFVVLKAQGQALLVDRGRQHAQSAGLSQGGSLDEYSFLWANHLLQNPHHCAVLEITLGNVSLQAQHNTMVAVTGADIPVQHNGNSVTPWSSFYVTQGDVIEVGFFRGRGTRLYLAVKGGFDAPLLYGSRSCVPREQLGGHRHGAPVQANDTLLCAERPTQTAAYTPPTLQKLPHAGQRIRFMPSYQFADFSPTAQQIFTAAPYHLSPHIDRMGFRLTGAALPLPEKELRSEGITLGSIQISREGQPMVLMSDRQSIGGYLKIGVVYRVDLSLLAQLAPGQPVQFVQGDIDTALALQQQREQFFSY